MLVISRKHIIMYDVQCIQWHWFPNEIIVSHSTQAVDLTLSRHKA